MNIELPSTADIVKTGTYFPSSTAFFSNFGSSWDAVACQVLKLETRQEYQEPENPSYQAFKAGNLELALDKIAEAKKDDAAIFKKIVDQKIDFIRCRPLVFPLSDYMKWAMHLYQASEQLGEKIYWCNQIQLSEIFDSYALHDFMIFDMRRAFVHDYDDDGLIQGGWIIDDFRSIVQLHTLFAIIKAECRPLSILTS